MGHHHTPAPAFSPALWLQRRAFALDLLRCERARSVFDVGCGPGSLVSVLCESPFHLDDFPPNQWDSPHGSHLVKLKNIPPLAPSDRELMLTRLVGMDVNKAALREAFHLSAPSDERESSWMYRERWCPLNVELWEGDATLYNPVLSGFEAITAIEVIEHLSESGFERFPKTVLGQYRPRVCLVTTPCYCFNQWFVAKSEEDEANHSFPDPTGRSNPMRVFRDSDHKFEFTSSEFKTWATAAADSFEYSLELGGIGSLLDYFGSSENVLSHQKTHNLSLDVEPGLLCATQYAVFRRKDELSMVQHLPHAQIPRDPESLSKLFGRHFHPAHRSAGQPVSRPRILKLLAHEMQDLMQISEITLREAWSRSGIRQAAGGKIGAIVEAIISDPIAWDFDILPDVTGSDSIQIKFKKFTDPKDVEEKLDEENRNLTKFHTEASWGAWGNSNQNTLISWDEVPNEVPPLQT